MTCNETERDISLYLYGELSATEREAFEGHAADCTQCRATVERARRLHLLLSGAAAPAPGPDALVRCRQRLEAALEAEQLGWRRLWSDWHAALSNPSRVAAALTLLVFGFGLGWMLRPRAAERLGNLAPSPAAADVSGGPDLGNISSISQVFSVPQSDKVRIGVNSERHVTLEGSLDDPRVRELLVDAMKNYSNPGIRLDTLDALKQRPNNPSVENALLYAMHNDPNAGVRMEALRSVPAMNWDATVENALVEAVRRDSNPGIRVAAIDDLVTHALDQHDLGLVPVLRDFAGTDSNPYVRVRALAAVHRLSQETK
ncbi:MAG: zf-HC2 domain-containing protein [Terriglobia bacterium]